MNLRTLRTVARRKRASQSDLARLAGVSRQAVCKWFQHGQGEVQIRSTHLGALADGLGVPAGLLLSDLDGLGPAEREALAGALLWDRAYPDLDAFLSALLDEQPRALGRLVEAYGMHESAKLVGQAVWTHYPEYRRYVHPARRRGLDNLVRWKENRTSA